MRGGFFLFNFGGLGRPGALWLPSRLKSLIFQYFEVQIGAFCGPQGVVGRYFGGLRVPLGSHFGGLGVPLGGFGAQSFPQTAGVF